MTKDEFVDKVVPLGSGMLRLASLLLGDRELAQDVVQECYVRLWRKRQDLNHCANLQAYVTTAVRNACLDKIRSMKKTIDIADYHAVKDYRGDYEHMESSLMVASIIKKLPLQQRQVIELRDIQGYAFEEIADILSLTVNHVRVSLSIARKKVKEQLLKIHDYGIKRS